MTRHPRPPLPARRARSGRRSPSRRPKHIDDWVTAQLEAKRGKVTVYRAVSTLRNALNAAVRSWRLRHNPAKHSVPPKPRAAERTCWTPDEAATVLRHNAEQYADQLTDLFEVMLGTGMRRGEIPSPALVGRPPHGPQAAAERMGPLSPDSGRPLRP
ncbi:hypothetical protein [Kitasatospora sp. NPDC058190]|uniref:hypothetical protein n=1 Tax=Kitasatospora sp. NPDC058190 TaxID=3346371 RepID=UPI0036DBD617